MTTEEHLKAIGKTLLAILETFEFTALPKDVQEYVKEIERVPPAE